MSEYTQRVLQQIADLRRQIANTHVTGTVHEVKDQKMRMVVGKDADGQPILSPWLNTSNMRGGARETGFYKKGQTVSLVCPGGDIRQGMVAPYAPNQNFPKPEHANSSGQDEENYQLDDLRNKTTKNGEDTWLQPEKKQSQSSQGGGQQQESQGHVGGDGAVMKTRMNASGGITNRIGKDVRFAAHKEGVKMRVKSDYVVVDREGTLIVSKPFKIKKDPVPQDNA